MTQRHRLFAQPDLQLSQEPIVLADGSLWSHAATLGTRVKGTEFAIDRAVVENFIRVFSSGYPQKVPVDYEHGTTSGATAMGQPVPKAGDVVELKGVFAADDFTGDLRTAAEKLAQLANRPLDDARNFGLWARWRPTARALRMIKDREYSELSIAFDDDLPHNSTGAGQGPALLAIALTNLPFLDDMLPVAASRGAGGSPADPGSHHQESKMTQKLTMLSVVAAVLGKAVATDDEAITELQQLQPELTSLRQYRAVVAEELSGETDPAKVVVSLRALKAESTAAKEQATAAKKAAVKTTVETTLKEYEKALTVPLREMIGTELTRELEAGAKLEETKSVATLKSLKATGITERAAGADAGAVPDEDDAIEAKAQELLTSDADLKELARSDRFRAYKLALVKAEKALGTTAR